MTADSMVNNGGEEKEVEECAKGILVGCGNPLLDIEADVTKQFLDEWKLKENDAILCDDQHIPMFQKLVSDFEVRYISGGSTQNTLRVCQWILNQPNCTVFFGAIGDDDYGRILEEKALKAGVNVRYQINKNLIKTGTCAALIYKHQRSLCAHLAAANTFTMEHLNSVENENFIQQAKYYYIAGFFLTVSPSSIMKIAHHAAEHNKIFMMNLAAPFISSVFLQPLLDALPYVDVLFGNESEAKAFAEANQLKTEDITEIALHIANLPKANRKRQRIVIITQGADPTIMVSKGIVKEFEVNRLFDHQIVDTNGAGDAFAGGFLSQFIQEKCLEDAIECGHYAARVIIQQPGCTLPLLCQYNL